MEKQNKILEEELKTYDAELTDLLESNRGKYVLIKKTKVIGIFESQKDAFMIGVEKFGTEPFLIKKIEETQEVQNYTSNLIAITGDKEKCPQ